MIDVTICANCGARIDLEPTKVRVILIFIHHNRLVADFCSPECLQAWSIEGLENYVRNLTA